MVKEEPGTAVSPGQASLFNDHLLVWQPRSVQLQDALRRLVLALFTPPLYQGTTKVAGLSEPQCHKRRRGQLVGLDAAQVLRAAVDVAAGGATKEVEVVGGGL